MKFIRNTSVLFTIIAVAASGFEATATTAPTQSETKSRTERRLTEVERKQQEIQTKLEEARRKAEHARRQERIALIQLNNVKSKLNNTTDALNQSQSKLQKTERKINECERNLHHTKSQEELQAEAAANRIRQIYEGQRLGLLEMWFEVKSLQHLLDVFYFQERIAEMDRKLLENLRAQAQALAAKKNQLGSQKDQLGDLVSEFARKALGLKREKDKKEEIADRLRTQRAFYEQAERQLEQESLQLERQIVEMTQGHQGNKSIKQGSGTMCMPLNAAVTSPFGWRRHPIFGIRKFHTGVDLAGPNHSPIRAADSGNVLYAGSYGGYGRVVIISHGNKKATLYAHLSKAAVSEGQNVSKGQVIGYEGSTGFSTGPHLHFEVRINGKPNNPMNFVR